MQKEAPFGPPAVEIGDVAAFRAPSEGTEATGDAADDATSAAPDPTIDVLEPLLRALAQMAVWQPPMMSPSKSSAAKAAAALAVPTHSMEQEAIRLIAFMAHGSVAVRDRVRELGGLFTVLQRCQLDEANPNIKEWAVFAIRNLTENSQANREFLAQIERAPCSVANPGVLEQADLEVGVNRQTGKLEVVRKTTTAETGTIV
ncbi:ataxin-10-like protein [Chrysochromulina tobinii]|uniref:Ataxin-10-like protein n=1 Tax=Chrysochromulina tobinii TaxID=1460289 RepID=A0A0M0JDM3_9EUKA|nr:ataxin-10-like protein [Chrysochromulina tobinii]|eukprot:KOO24694.1 ataxin-10-like protein [Chrysochromulina sp. CCMP291]